MNRMRKFGIVVLAAITIVSSTGCPSVGPAIDRFFGVETETPNEAEFFICNTWQDSPPYNGFAESDEFKGKGTLFRSHQEIIVVGRVANNKGSVFGIKVFDGENKIVGRASGTITLPAGEYKVMSFAAGELYEKGGMGEYTVKFYLNDNFIEKRNFTLIK